MYDQHGKSTGTAAVHFVRVGDAALAYSKFNGVPLDGKQSCHVPLQRFPEHSMQQF